MWLGRSLGGALLRPRSRAADAATMKKAYLAYVDYMIDNILSRRIGTTKSR